MTMNTIESMRLSTPSPPKKRLRILVINPETKRSRMKTVEGIDDEDVLLTEIIARLGLVEDVDGEAGS